MHNFRAAASKMLLKRAVAKEGSKGYVRCKKFGERKACNATRLHVKPEHIRKVVFYTGDQTNGRDLQRQYKSWGFFSSFAAAARVGWYCNSCRIPLNVEVQKTGVSTT